MSVGITKSAGTLAPPACYETEQQRFEAYVAALLLQLTGENLQWQRDQAAIADKSKYWLRDDASGNPTEPHNWSLAQGDWVKWLSIVVNTATVGGSGDAITLTNPKSMTSDSAYGYGRVFIFQASAANTIPGVTVQIDGHTAIPIKKFGAVSLSPADISADQIVILVMDGINAQIINPTFPDPSTLKQFLVFESVEQSLPSSGGFLSVPHGFVDGSGNGIVPFMFRTVIKRTAIGSVTFTYPSGGSATISEGQEIEHDVFWYGGRGSENEWFGNVFRPFCDDTNCNCSVYFTSDLIVWNTASGPLADGGHLQTGITPGDYKLKFYAMARNPAFTG